MTDLQLLRRLSALPLKATLVVEDEAGEAWAIRVKNTRYGVRFFAQVGDGPERVLYDRMEVVGLIFFDDSGTRQYDDAFFEGPF